MRAGHILNGAIIINRKWKVMCFLQNSWPYGLIQVYVKLEIQSFSVHFSVDNICLTTPQILINVATVRWITVHINIATALCCTLEMARLVL